MNFTQDFGPLDVRDRELAAALHALAAPILRGRVEAHVDVDGRGIDFATLLEQPWPCGERTMIELACTLRRAERIADARVSPIVHTLHEENTRALEAVL